MKLIVKPEFIEYREEKRQQYNQRNRSDRKFLMDLDAELYEWDKLNYDEWLSSDDWRIDAFDEWGRAIDVKFIRKYWNVSREKTLNLIKQRNVLYGYLFMEWVSRPSRPLMAGDEVEVKQLGYIDYNTVADSLKKSFKEPDGFYVDVRTILEIYGKET